MHQPIDRQAFCSNRSRNRIDEKRHIIIDHCDAPEQTFVTPCRNAESAATGLPHIGRVQHEAGRLFKGIAGEGRIAWKKRVAHSASDLRAVADIAGGLGRYLLFQRLRPLGRRL